MSSKLAGSVQTGNQKAQIKLFFNVITNRKLESEHFPRYQWEEHQVKTLRWQQKGKAKIDWHWKLSFGSSSRNQKVWDKVLKEVSWM